MCEAGDNFKLIGILMSEKKYQKLRMMEFMNVCRLRGYDLVKLDLKRPLEEQGPLKVFIHKLTDVIAAAEHGDAQSKELIANVEQYISNHPDMTVIDPLNNVRILLDRYRYYSLLENQPLLKKHGVFTPPFCILYSNNHAENLKVLQARGVTFPLVCKPKLAHGSKSAHKMSVVFNEAGLIKCKPPCVLQSFINHNAVLYKIFLIGNRYYVTERPSLKNFYACSEREPIYFQSGDVCKADSQSTLSILDPHEVSNIELNTTLDDCKIEAIIKVLRKELQLVLFGVDVVVDNMTNHYAIIDINVYPGYEGYSNFFENLIDTIDEMIESTNDTISENIPKEKGKDVSGHFKNEYRSSDNCKVFNEGLDNGSLINVSREKIDGYYTNILKSHNSILEPEEVESV